MPVRSDPSPRRIAVFVTVCVVALIGIAIATSVLPQFRGLGQREAIVHFKDGTTAAQRETVRKACAAPPAVRAEPVPRSRQAARLNDVRYRINTATDTDVANLSRCLQRYPYVLGIQPVDLTG